MPIVTMIFSLSTLRMQLMIWWGFYHEFIPFVKVKRVVGTLLVPINCPLENMIWKQNFLTPSYNVMNSTFIWPNMVYKFSPEQCKNLNRLFIWTQIGKNQCLSCLNLLDCYSSLTTTSKQVKTTRHLTFALNRPKDIW